jgi:RNA polymerase sigma-70 factor (ECF subfamily)
LKALHKEADERLLIEAAQRDPARFADLYERNFARVYAYISRRVQGRDEAEDLTSEVFQHALAHLGRFEWRGVPFAAWLYRIAANAIHDRRKQAGRESPSLEENVESEDAAEEIERRAMLFELVDDLAEDQRRVIVQRFVEQKSIKEIAQELRRTEGAVKQLQFRALQNLRTKMEGAYE